MKAKILLTSMVLPALFAACTNDEIVGNNGGSISGRKMFEPVGVTLAGDAQTRFEWNEGTFGWNAFTAEDKFSAGLVDGTKLWQVGNTVATNFVYTSTDGTNFTTPSKMMEGVYFFYSYPGFENLSNRSAVPFDLNATQSKIDLTNPKANVDNAQFFVSPLYKIEAAQADASIPVVLRSYWSTAVLKVKNTSDAAFKVVRIVLDANTQTFAVKGALELTKLGTADEDNAENKKLVYYYDRSEGKYVLPKDKEGNRLTEKELWALDLVDKTAEDYQAQQVIMVDVENGEVAAGKEATAYIQVPAGVYDKVTAKIYVEVKDEDGNAQVKMLEKDLTNNWFANAEATEATKVVFNRGRAVAAFGKTSAGTPASYEVDAVELISAVADNVKYAANFADFSKIVTAAGATNVEIFNVGSLEVNDEVINLMTRLSSREVTFKNPINVTTASSSVVALKNIKFAGEAKVVRGKFELAADVLAKTATMNVGEGTSVKVSATQSGTIENEGAVEVAIANTATVGTVPALVVNHAADNEATLTISKDITIGAAATDDALQLTGSMPSELNINGTQTSKVAVTTKGAIDLKETVNVSAYATFKTGDAAADKLSFKDGAEVSNRGTIAKVGSGVLTVVGKSVTVGSTTTITTSKVDNWGVLDGAKLDQYALVNMKDGSAKVQNITNGGNAVVGEIDNTIGGFVLNTTGVTVFAKYNSDVTGNPVKAQGCNKLIMENCTWTDVDLKGLDQNITVMELTNVVLKSSISTTTPIAAAELPNLTDATLKNCTIENDITFPNETTILDVTGSTFKKSLTADNAANDDTVLDNATFKGVTSFGALTDVTLIGVTIDGSFTMNGAATNLKIGKAGLTSTNKVYTTTTVNGTLNAPAKLTVNNYATLNVSANSKIAGAVAGITLTVEQDAKLTNKGSISNVRALVGEVVGNQPTLPASVTNLEKGTYFIGEAATTVTTVKAGAKGMAIFKSAVAGKNLVIEADSSEFDEDETAGLKIVLDGEMNVTLGTGTSAATDWFDTDTLIKNVVKGEQGPNSIKVFVNNNGGPNTAVDYDWDGTNGGYKKRGS